MQNTWVKFIRLFTYVDLGIWVGLLFEIFISFIVWCQTANVLVDVVVLLNIYLFAQVKTTIFSFNYLQ